MLTNEQRRELGELARAYNLPEAHVLAVVDVESNGKVFADVEGQQRPLILFEPHIFYRRLAGAERTRAVNLGLAYAKGGTKPYPASQAARWRQLEQAAQINREAAYESASYGVGQVMGFHWQALGFKSVDELVMTARSGLRGQADLMLRFIRVNGLEDHLRAGRWAPFARGYNGKGYAKNKYDAKLKAAAATYGGADQPAAGMLRMGSKGARVRELQALLVRAGYAVKADGDFGPTTERALKGFQEARGLTADGIYGPQTETALAAYRQEQGDKPGAQKALDISAVKKGGVAALGSAILAEASPEVIAQAKAGLEAAAAQITGAGVKLVVLDYLATGLTVAAAIAGAVGVAVAIIGFVRSKQTVEA
ncbi:N-acetylmuramidase domain-containing protein [Aureimonas sp. ME7]|uniref:N-acetylmuramidase domain-containing protein n=1 Tax=Aureimonas sp. ME7 TaxID=2744252 RepID=UPI0015F8CF8E|nr:N-acetylmuramidase domain-containing protein [Aureimonas sp. ME7]